MLRRVFPRILILAAFTLGACGCVGLLWPDGSGGRPPRPAPAPPTPQYNAFTIEYKDQLTFNHDLTVAVDNVLARIAAGDDEALKLAREFIAPGFEVLADHDIHLNVPLPIANPAAHELTFQTRWSQPFTPDILLSGKPLCTALTLDRLPKDGCRWQASLTTGELEFNSLHSRILNVHATLEVRVQRRQGSDWVYVDIDRDAEGKLTSTIGSALVRRYYQYFKSAGVDVTSPKFEGFYREQH